MRRLLLPVFALLAACGGAGTSSPTAATPASPVSGPPLPATLVGVWETTITADDQAAAAALAGARLDHNIGRWQLTLGSDSYKIEGLSSAITEEGTASAAGDVLTFQVTRLSRHAECTTPFPVGSVHTYRFTVERDTLRLAAGQGTCADDVLVLTAHPLQRMR